MRFFRDVVLLGLFFLDSRLAVFTYQRGDLFAVQIEKRGSCRSTFVTFPVPSYSVSFFGGAPASVIFFYFVRRFLVGVNFRTNSFLRSGDAPAI